MKFFENARVGNNKVSQYVALILAGYFAAQIPSTIYVVALIIDKMSNGNREAALEMMAGNNILAIFDTIPGFIAFMLTFAVWLGTTWWLFKPLHKRERMTLISGEKKFRFQNFNWGIIGYGLILTLITCITMITDPDCYTVSEPGGRYYLFVALCIVLVPIQTSCEEFIFRGYLMQGFALCTKSKVWALVITSVLFGLLHCLNNEVLANGFFTTIPIYIEIGLLMGFFAILSDGIEISCGMHFINNFLAFTVFSSEGGTLSGNALVTFKRGAVSVSDYLIPIAVAALIYLCLHKKMGWDIKKAFDNSGLRKDVPPPYFA